ncbi:hypothetical protein KC207_05415 [Phycicoccus sp. BSK3Z-2]|uniref:MmcQ/YjbR family DNA-binding protein n=1 Tax=Phycicoccus avicenniae TaxID=2828860 RepID=A0A941D922_9MICO|nr:hypothetical protein [Phycicoccus avicenniae]MBR7742727.1 hypothetical protein [Phycicoccus avicenniae]
MDLDGFGRAATSLDGVRRRTVDGRARWTYDGRLVARALDADHVVVRVPFEVRDELCTRAPTVFDVPRRFRKHMMVVADLVAGDDEAVEDALEAAWSFQRSQSDT